MSNSAPSPTASASDFRSIKIGDKRSGLTVKHVITASSNFAIYETAELAWFRIEGNDLSHRAFHVHFVALRRLVRLCDNWAPKALHRNIAGEAGIVMSRCLADPDNPMDAHIWDELTAQIEQYAIDRTGLIILGSSALFAVVAGAIGYAVIKWPGLIAPESAPLVKAAVFGMLGALASGIFRISRLTVKSCRSRLAALLQGTVRPLLGCFFGAFAYLAIQADLIAGVAAANTHLLWAVIFVSGFSERLIPDAIARIEKPVSTEDPAAKKD